MGQRRYAIKRSGGKRSAAAAQSKDPVCLSPHHRLDSGFSAQNPDFDIKDDDSTAVRSMDYRIAK